ncbi:hypothetical protein Y032_0009g641 [Ancylostoma ceylanicum]|nr:hypothetical protein Y032_0009g641 [Ancylostoma ceylanicum]
MHSEPPCKGQFHVIFTYSGRRCRRYFAPMAVTTWLRTTDALGERSKRRLSDFTQRNWSNEHSEAPMVLDTQNQLSALDQHVAPGLRLWMLIALVSGVLLIMVVLVCCFMRIRIPRTKRQIDLIAAKRKMRNKSAKTVHADERAQAIVMNSMRPKSSTAQKPSIAEQPMDEQPLVHKGSKQHTEV